MADIVEYAFLARDAGNHTIPAGQEPCIAVQQIAPSGVSQQSSAFSGSTRVVRIHTDAAIRIAFGASPVAAATSQRVAANTTEYFGVHPGHKVAVINA